MRLLGRRLRNNLGYRYHTGLSEPVWTLVFQDDFNDTNGASITTHAPTGGGYPPGSWSAPAVGNHVFTNNDITNTGSQQGLNDGSFLNLLASYRKVKVELDWSAISATFSVIGLYLNQSGAGSNGYEIDQNLATRLAQTSDASIVRSAPTIAYNVGDSNRFTIIQLDTTIVAKFENLTQGTSAVLNYVAPSSIARQTIGIRVGRSTRMIAKSIRVYSG